MVYSMKSVARNMFLDLEQLEHFARTEGHKHGAFQEYDEMMIDTWYHNDFVKAAREAGVQRVIPTY